MGDDAVASAGIEVEVEVDAALRERLDVKRSGEDVPSMSGSELSRRSSDSDREFSERVLSSSVAGSEIPEADLPDSIKRMVAAEGGAIHSIADAAALMIKAKHVEENIDAVKESLMKKKSREVDVSDTSKYMLTRAMSLGIATMISRFNDDEKLDSQVITDKFFLEERKVKFPKEGSKETPPHDLKKFYFKEYAGRVFAKIRKLFAIPTKDFMKSVCAKEPFLDFATNSKSGEFFFFTHDKKFMIKTMSKEEQEFVLEGHFLKKYYDHLSKFPKTLLVPILGIFKVGMFGNYHRFLVMKNVFPHHSEVHQKFDLKGSLVGRSLKSSAKMKLSPVKKDQDMIDEGVFVYLGEGYEEVLAQIVADARFLASMGVMDYSMLVGIHDKRKAMEKEILRVEGEKKQTGKPFSKLKERIKRHRKSIDKMSEAATDIKRDPSPPKVTSAGSSSSLLLPQDSGSMDSRFDSSMELDSSFVSLSSSRFGRSRGGDSFQMRPEDVKELILSAAESEYDAPRGGFDDATKDRVIYLGIIDIFQTFTWKKSAERALKGITVDKKLLSAVPPEEYCHRFIMFMKDRLRSNPDSVSSSPIVPISESVSPSRSAEAGDARK